MTYLLDTDHVSILVQGGGQAAALRARLAARPTGDWGASVVSLHEQTRGLHTLIERRRRPDLSGGYELLRRTVLFDQRFDPLPFDAAALAEFTRLRTILPNKPGVMDLRIAAVALVHDLTLLTRNTADFAPVPGLRAEDWTALRP